MPTHPRSFSLCGTGSERVTDCLTDRHADLICACSGRPTSDTTLSPIPHTPRHLTSVQPARHRVACPLYQRTYRRTIVPRWETPPRGCTQLYCAAQLGMPSRRALVSKDGLPRPAPS